MEYWTVIQQGLLILFNNVKGHYFWYWSCAIACIKDHMLSFFCVYIISLMFSKYAHAIIS